MLRFIRITPRASQGTLPRDLDRKRRIPPYQYLPPRTYYIRSTQIPLPLNLNVLFIRTDSVASKQGFAEFQLSLRVSNTQRDRVVNRSIFWKAPCFASFLN